MKLTVYLSGPMTGIEDLNVPAFNAAAEKLRAAGYGVVNPADGGADETKAWEDYLREDLHMLLDCDAVALLPGWSGSRGAKLEKYVAEQLNMPTAGVSFWLDNSDRVVEIIRELVS